ncbi:hypothetical protein MUN82_13270 [Hymenobacter aerilatus]|uniref:Macroglobulin domain-containing protein n=1 Tax=Hymenobacter aerilatus TaxID=2932251 RepID=A0A8T9SSC2_9BACT|nr:hypothetical protein [Hymenobacter aerilatus]UOR03914.1 hypothetical protein MUN82_13270 [Hymenobacter aerilatus]
MRLLLSFFLVLLTATVQAAAPQLLLDVAQFRNEDRVVKGSVVELYATVPGTGLTYLRRAPKTFQAAAVLTLEILKADGKPAYQETVTLKPPVLSDTTAAIKNPISFQKRVALPDGQYTVRARLRDQYKASNATTVDQSLTLKSDGKAAYLSDIVLLARPAAKSGAQDNFARGGLRLSRAPGGYYGRGTAQIFFYAELYQAPAGQPLKVRYRIASDEGGAAEAETTLEQAAQGKPTTIVGELPLGPLPSGQYVFTIEIRDAKNQLLTTQSTVLTRDMEEYAPAGATN